MRFTAQQYVDDVLSGAVPACEWVRLACQRHVDDLERQNSAEFPFFFSQKSAKLAIAFFPTLLRHWKGEWAGQPIHLEPWQQFVLWELFGWKRSADGMRRYRSAYVEIPRKNGKTTLAGGIGLLLMVADGEPGAEIYTAATKRDQARIAHRDAAEMVKQSPALKKHVVAFKDNLHCEATRSKFEPLGRDADSLDGLNVHGAIIDEFHAHKTRDLYNKLETATGSRRQPLIVTITTAGSDQQSVCFEFHDYTEKVLQRNTHDETHFGIIYTLDEGDDWEDETTWYKANPNLGVSKKIEDMRRLANRAKEIPAQLNAFLQLHLDRWVTAASRWIGDKTWKHNARLAVDPERLVGRQAFGGLDLATTTDIAAWLLVFPPVSADDPFEVLCRFYCPEENIVTRSKVDRVPYVAWQRDGWLTATPGNVIDYDWIYRDIDVDAQRFTVKEIAFDRWGSRQIVTDLQQRGMTMIDFGQGFASMSPAMREFEKLLLSGRLAHGNNPVLNWMAANVVARRDAAGNMKPDKEKSREKIDGIVALLMGLARAVLHAPKVSVYSQRGLRTL